MYWNIQKTTSRERATICNAMCSIFADLERAETLLDVVIEDNFVGMEQRPLTRAEAELVGTLLHIARDIVSNSVSAYYLITARPNNGQVKSYIKSMETVKAAMQCESALEDVSKLEMNLPEEQRKLVMEARAKTGDMEDAAAILALNSLAESGGENG